MTYHLHHGDCLDVLADMAASSVDLIVADPPYWSTGKAAVGDRQWPTAAAYLAWLDTVLAQWQRVLRPNGSLYCFAAPDMAARVEVAIGARFNVLNQIVWQKAMGWHQKAAEEALRGYFPATERIIFAEHVGSDSTAMQGAGYEAKCDELRGFVFEPLRAYLDGERRRAGIDFDQVRQIVECASGSGLPSHWFTCSQWMLPTAANYEKLRQGFNASGGAFLQRPYEDLRREYEELRRPFHATADAPYTDVWDFPTVAHYPGKHPCEKPRAMLEHIIRISSRPHAVVLDPFLGSGVSGVAARVLGRRFIGIERDSTYYTQAARRIAQAAAQQPLEAVG